MASRVSVIVPVLHEAVCIDRTLEQLCLTIADPREIIVVDGDPRGDTLAAVTASGIKMLHASRGRGSQMNAGAAAAQGDILLFLHADTRLPEDAGRYIRTVCEAPDIAGGAFDLGIDSPRFVFRLIEKAASWRSRLTRIPYGDQAIFIKTAVFWQMNGFRPIPIMEDVDLMCRLKRQGHRLRFISRPVRTSARRWEAEGVLYATLRNYFLLVLFCLGVSPHRLQRYYR